MRDYWSQSPQHPHRVRLRMHRFTLLELAVAMAIFMLVAMVLFAFARGIAASWERLHGEQQQFSRLLALDRTLDRMLSNAVPFQWRDLEREPMPFFLGEGNRCRLAVLHPVYRTEDGGLRFVELFLEDDKLMARFSQRPYLEWQETAGLTGQSILAWDVDRIEFQYVDWSGDELLEWEDRMVWTSEWDPERKELPLAIWITVTWQDGRAETWLRRTAGAGWRERYSGWAPASEEDERP